MKKLTLFFVLLIFSCELQDFDVIDVYDFKVNMSIIENEIYLNETSEILLQIKPSRQILTSKYDISFNVTQGEVDLFFDNEMIDQNQKITTELLDNTFHFKSKSIEEIKIEFEISHHDDPELKEIKEVSIITEFRPLNIELFTNSDNYIINEFTPLTLNLSDNSEQEKEFTLNYQIQEGLAELYELKGGIYQKIIKDEDFVLKSGIHTLYYKPLEIGNGNHILSLNIIAEDGNTTKSFLSLEITNLPWEITLAAETTLPKKNQSYELIFNLEQGKEGIENKIKFEVIGGNVDILHNNVSVEYGVWSDSSPGITKYNFVSKEETVSEIKVSVRDQNNFIKEKIVVIETTAIPFIFEAFAELNSVVLNSPLLINLSVQTEYEVSEIDYSFGILKGNGELKNNVGAKIIPADLFTSSAGSTKVYYTPTSLGEHKLVFNAFLD